MIVVERRRTVAAPRSTVWAVLIDPWRFGDWWPRAVSSERAGAGAWRVRLAPPRRPQATVTAVFERCETHEPTRFVFRQRVEGTPFGRTFRRVEWAFELARRGDGVSERTEIAATARVELKGLGRLGSLQVRRAFRRTADSALARLDALLAGDPRKA
ncbi:MAG: SRPBCC family protein [Thermoleophilum sp.]|nr:SRPBCC family protein [Thermoleophilum sp.]